VVRVEPGQTNLAYAAPIQLTDLQIGDRILVRGLPSDDGKTFTAVRVVAMKRADVDAKHKEQATTGRSAHRGNWCTALTPHRTS